MPCSNKQGFANLSSPTGGQGAVPAPEICTFVARKILL